MLCQVKKTIERVASQAAREGYGRSNPHGFSASKMQNFNIG